MEVLVTVLLCKRLVSLKALLGSRGNHLRGSVRRNNTAILVVLIATVKCLEPNSLRVYVPPFGKLVCLRVLF